MASGDEWLAENVPGVKWINEAQVSVNEWKQDVSNDVQSLVETIKQQQAMFGEVSASSHSENRIRAEILYIWGPYVHIYAHPPTIIRP